ncbi:MAG TPA: tetratricopeptide repeat protein, partial [Chitinophagaceae bacterium]|nr:tetratricopeptide repeat protein [Chitinophagaceae bacterium]
MKLYAFFVIALQLTGIYVTAQPKQGKARLDSLIGEAPRIHDDSDGVRLLYAISFGYLNIAPEEVLQWANKELDLAKKISWHRGEAFAYCNIGQYYNDRGNYDKALETLVRARKIFHEIGDNRKEAEALLPIGNIYLYKKNYQTALEYYSNSLKFAVSIQDMEWQQTALSNIGNVYAGWAKPDKALEYMKKALKIAVSQNDIAGIML